MTVGSYIGTLLHTYMCVHTHTHQTEPSDRKSSCLGKHTLESSSGLMLIVSVSFIYARETMGTRCPQLSANNKSVFAGQLNK